MTLTTSFQHNFTDQSYCTGNKKNMVKKSKLQKKNYNLLLIKDILTEYAKGTGTTKGYKQIQNRLYLYTTVKESIHNRDCLNLVFYCCDKHQDLKQPGWERVYSAYTVTLQPTRKSGQDFSTAGSWRQEPLEVKEGTADCLAPGACSTCFLGEPGTGSSKGQDPPLESTN